jgi:hypothetical protein
MGKCSGVADLTPTVAASSPYFAPSPDQPAQQVGARNDSSTEGSRSGADVTSRERLRCFHFDAGRASRKSAGLHCLALSIKKIDRSSAH